MQQTDSAMLKFGCSWRLCDPHWARTGRARVSSDRWARWCRTPAGGPPGLVASVGDALGHVAVTKVEVLAGFSRFLDEPACARATMLANLPLGCVFITSS